MAAAAVVPRAQLTRKTIPLPLAPPSGAPSGLRSRFLPTPRRSLLLPRPATASGFSMRVTSKQAYICRDCGYIYSDRKPFEKLPDSYFCPVCGAPKRRFRSYQPAVAKNANETDARKARKAQLKREEAIGNALPIGIAVGAALLVALYFYLNSIY